MRKLLGLWRRLPHPLRLGAALFLVDVALFGLLRAAFWAAFRGTAPPAPSGDILKSFWLGLRFDIRLAIFLALPLLALPWFPRLDPLRSPAARRVWSLVMGVKAFFLALVYAIDFGHYDWLHERLTVGALEHANEPGIAAEIVWETYPVVWALLALAAGTAGYAWAAGRFVFRAPPGEPAPLPRRARAAAAVVGADLRALGISSRFGYPLR
jgi:hypothetical protein